MSNDPRELSHGQGPRLQEGQGPRPGGKGMGPRPGLPPFQAGQGPKGPTNQQVEPTPIPRPAPSDKK
jgi:hypothetical protein